MTDGRLALQRRWRLIPRTWFDWVVTSCAVLATVLVGIAIEVVPGHAAAPPNDAVRVGVQHLRDLLGRRTASLQAQQQSAVLEQARAELEQLKPAMLWLLEQPRHKLFPAVATLAAELEVVDAVEPLRRAVEASGGGRCAAAVLALEHFEPLSTPKLRELLEAKEAGVAATGLQILATRDGTPTELIESVLGLVGGHDLANRQAALSCLPAELGGQHADIVLQWLDQPQLASVAFDLLKRLPPGARGAEAVAARLGSADEAQLNGILPVAEVYASEDSVRTALWQIVENGERLRVRVLALECLERAHQVANTPASSGTWPPVLQFHLARIQVQNGDLAGVDALLELMEVDPGASIEDRDVAGRARSVLGRFAGMPAHADRATLAAWRSRLQLLPTAAGATPR